MSARPVKPASIEDEPKQAELKTQIIPHFTIKPSKFLLYMTNPSTITKSNHITNAIYV